MILRERTEPGRVGVESLDPEADQTVLAVDDTHLSNWRTLGRVRRFQVI